MDVRKWSKSEVEYGRRILGSGLEGIRSGREEFLQGKPLAPFLSKSAIEALKPAAIGACIGMLGSLAGNHQKSMSKALLFGLLGGAIGFGTGMVWESRSLTGSAARGALRNVHTVRDGHWLEKHPVAYA